jgi:hypothetical protein
MFRGTALHRSAEYKRRSLGSRTESNSVLLVRADNHELHVHVHESLGEGNALELKYLITQGQIDKTCQVINEYASLLKAKMLGYLQRRFWKERLEQ